jgi:hypothetical protein
MRGALGFCVFLSFCACFGQQNPPDLFQTMRPDLMIVVSKHPTGADDLEITTLAKNYPQALLAKQIQDLGSQIGSAPRGLSIASTNPIPGNANTAALRAIFAVSGLIQRDKNILGLQAIARAFAASPENGKANALMIQFSTESPTSTIVQRFRSEAVELQASADPRFGLEYRIKLSSTDPAKIVIPEGQAAKDFRAAKPEPAPKGGPDWSIIVVIAIAALAVGALVYSLLLRPRPKTPPK